MMHGSRIPNIAAAQAPYTDDVLLRAGLWLFAGMAAVVLAAVAVDTAFSVHMMSRLRFCWA